jgi:hypothetical protein
MRRPTATSALALALRAAQTALTRDELAPRLSGFAM